MPVRESRRGAGGIITGLSVMKRVNSKAGLRRTYAVLAHPFRFGHLVGGIRRGSRFSQSRFQMGPVNEKTVKLCDAKRRLTCSGALSATERSKAVRSIFVTNSMLRTQAPESVDDAHNRALPPLTHRPTSGDDT